ncbi:MAG TPA: hypothetical protein VFZ09_03960 [Archangium sp.]|uniref:hypothetical protein n=1 Tax=Archangium sp. TaxID=1872627 RepID=UPI002E3480E2|nr:hypothetical protein [Archangium sp.]HEX5745374.1 hypothetical protein [Archangium sp.]
MAGLPVFQGGWASTGGSWLGLASGTSGPADPAWRLVTSLRASSDSAGSSARTASGARRTRVVSTVRCASASLPRWAALGTSRRSARPGQRSAASSAKGVTSLSR